MAEFPIWVPFASALVGALVGGGISASVAFRTQKKTFEEARSQKEADRKEALRQKEADRKEAQKASMLTLLTKMLRIADNLHLLENTWDGLLRAKAEGTSLWQALHPIGNLPGKVHFEAHEVAALLRADPSLVLVFGTFDDEYNGTVGLFEIYRSERAALETDLKGRTPESIEPEEHRRIDPMVGSVERLAQDTSDRTRKKRDEAVEHVLKLQDVMKKNFDISPIFMRSPSLPGQAQISSDAGKK